MARKYLERISGWEDYPQLRLRDLRQRFRRWRKRRKFGFDTTDVWALDATIFEFFYERLSYMLEETIVDWSAMEVTIDGVTKTEELWIKEMIDTIRPMIAVNICELPLDNMEQYEKDVEEYERRTKHFYNILAALHFRLWT